MAQVLATLGGMYGVIPVLGARRGGVALSTVLAVSCGDYGDEMPTFRAGAMRE